jgi:phosphate starvation-inducible membrane PsiE
MIEALGMIAGCILLTIFLFTFSPSFPEWLKAYPMPDGSESGKLMPGILIWFFIYFSFSTLIIFIIWIFRK